MAIMTCTSTVCGATRPRLTGSGWICDGTDLTRVMPASATLPPVVIRTDLIPYLGDAEVTFLPGVPFPGGDHVHLVIAVPLIKPRAPEPA